MHVIRIPTLNVLVNVYNNYKYDYCIKIVETINMYLLHIE